MNTQQGDTAKGGKYKKVLMTDDEDIQTLTDK
jgi:hypothetical protein